MPKGTAKPQKARDVLLQQPRAEALAPPDLSSLLPTVTASKQKKATKASPSVIQGPATRSRVKAGLATIRNSEDTGKTSGKRAAAARQPQSHQQSSKNAATSSELPKPASFTRQPAQKIADQVSEDQRPSSSLPPANDAWPAGPERALTLQSSPLNSSPVNPDGFWRRLGYDRSDTPTASPSSSMRSSRSTPARSRASSRAPSKKSQNTEAQGIKTARPENSSFVTTLMLYNINTKKEEKPDSKLAEILELVDRDREYPPDEGNETRWQHDMSKSAGSHEAIFQRTIMMEIIERHELNEKLDFMCEITWGSSRMPRRDQEIQLSQPKPDLTIAFKTTSLLPEDYALTDLMGLGNLVSHLFPEGTSDGGIERTFHFLSIEVKGKNGKVGNVPPRNQNLNTAAQALHNIYVVMKKAKLEETFFRAVRFFSIVATTACFELRVHRPIKLIPSQPKIEHDYPVRFGYDEVLEIGSSYTKAMASRTVYNILYHYGVKKLHPIMKQALAIVLGLESATQAVESGEESANSEAEAGRAGGTVEEARAAATENGSASVADTSRRRGSTRGRAANRGRERTREGEVIQQMLPPGKRAREDDGEADSFGESPGAAKHRFRDLNVHGDK